MKKRKWPVEIISTTVNLKHDNNSEELPNYNSYSNKSNKLIFVMQLKKVCFKKWS